MGSAKAIWDETQSNTAVERIIIIWDIETSYKSANVPALFAS